MVLYVWRGRATSTDWTSIGCESIYTILWKAIKASNDGGIENILWKNHSLKTLKIKYEIQSSYTLKNTFLTRNHQTKPLLRLQTFMSHPGKSLKVYFWWFKRFLASKSEKKIREFFFSIIKTTIFANYRQFSLTFFHFCKLES